MEWQGTNLYYAAAMLWALIPGFSISSALPVFVSKEKMVKYFAFSWLGLVPQGMHGNGAMMPAGFSWNYTTWLNIVALPGGGYPLYLHFGQSHQEKHKHAPKQAQREHHAH